MKDYIQRLLNLQEPKLTHRYVGSMVADFHRNMIHGGVFGYPAEETKPDGKIRLLYEAAPLLTSLNKLAAMGLTAHSPYWILNRAVSINVYQFSLATAFLVEKAEEFMSGRII